MIGELTPWYTRQKEYADSQLTQQQAALGAMKLDSIMKAQKDFEQMSAEDKLKQAATPTPIPTDKAKVAPTAVPTSSTETTPTTRSADGTPMPSFNTGTTSAEPVSTSMPSFMSTGKPEEAVKPVAEANAATDNKTPEQKEKTQIPLLQEMKNSNVDYKASQDRVDFMYRFADKLRNNGNLLAYQDAIKVADNAKTTMYDHQIKNLALQDKFLDTASGPVYAYKKAMEKLQLDTSNPESLKAYQESSDKAWATMKLDLQSRGIPTSSIDGINSWQDRAQRADSFINGALNGKEQITLATKEAELKVKEERNRLMDRHMQNQDNLAVQKQIFNQAKFGEKGANDLLKDSESDLKSLRMAVNTAMSKEDRDGFRKALVEAQAKHDQLVKDLKEKAKTDGIKWTPVVTNVANQNTAPAVTTDNTAAAPTPTKETKPGTVATGGVFKGLSEEAALQQTKEHLQNNPNNKAQAEKLFKESFPNSTFNFDGTSNEPKKSTEEITKEKKLKRIAEIEKKLNATPLKLTGSKGLGIYGQLMQGASTLGVAERKELEIELKRLKSETS